MSEKTRYSDEELQEFKELILAKIEKAQREYDTLRASLMNNEGNDVADTSPTFKVLEEGAYTLGKEEAARLAERQRQFIQKLQAALVRIENKTYGICKTTGKLIPKERLMRVPHATECIEAKEGRLSRLAQHRRQAGQKQALMKLGKGALAAIIIIAVVVLDQWLKIWVKTSFYLGEDVELLPFFHLRFVQNPGMAFGMELGSKLFLTLFRIVVTCLGFWYIAKKCKVPEVPRGYIACVALVVAGALGNIFDCLFYGEIFTNPAPPQVAQFVPFGEGYGTLFHGMVVDMLYFPLFSFVWPDWVPWLGGSWFSFFDPVFNLADAAISVGMIAILLFYSRLLVASDEEADKPAPKK